MISGTFFVFSILKEKKVTSIWPFEPIQTILVIHVRHLMVDLFVGTEIVWSDSNFCAKNHLFSVQPIKNVDLIFIHVPLSGDSGKFTEKAPKV